MTLLLSVSLVWAANVPLNIVGTVSGTCDAHVSVSMYGYCPGEIGNASCSIDNATAVANGGGAYGSSLTYDNAVYVTGIDVLVVADNSSCSSVATGNNSLSNAVGGGPPVTIDVNITNTFTLDTPTNGSTVTNQTITFTWTNNIVTPNSTIQIDNQSDFSSIDESQTNIADPNVTIATTLADGVYYWRVLTYIGANLIQQSGVYNFTLSNSTPLILTIDPDNTTWLTASSTTLNLTTDMSATCAYATSSGVAYAAKTPFTSTASTSHSTTVSLSTQGANNFYLQCNGSNGKLMPTEIQTTIYRDSVDPVATGATASIDSGAVYSTNSTLNISWAGFTDATSGLAGYYVNTTNNQGTSTGQFSASSSTLLSGISDGIITAFVWAIDQAGNIGLAASDSITVDTTAPTYGSWSTSPINVNKFTTSDLIVYVTVSDVSSLNTLPQLRYAIGADAYTASADMTVVGGSVYSFTIPNQASPNDWASRAGENISYIVNATDARGFSSSDIESTFINDQFTAPVFSPLALQNIDQAANSSMRLRGFDADGDTLSFTANNSDISFVTINASDSYAYWQPDNDDVGSNIIIFTVTDGYYNVSQAVIVNVTNQNDAPVLPTIPALSAYEYVEFSYTINSTDPDGDSLSYSTNSSLFVISTDGEILFTPTATDRGAHSIEYVASDGNGGFDRQNATFTVLYCGDAVCSSTYETSATCSLDCEDDDDSQGFIIDSKTCVGEALLIRAVELVPRTTCKNKGIIINGWESCDNISDTTINIEQDISDSYVQITSLITNEFGIASFKTNETGDYRIRYDSSDYDENIVYFSINECSLEDEENTLTTSTDEDDQPEVNLPFFEEPLTDEQILKLSNASKVVYFILLPFLFILVAVAGVTTYYRYDKKKGSGTFSNDVDGLLKKLNNQWMSSTKQLRSSNSYKQVASIFATLASQFIDAKKLALKKVEPYVKSKELSVPFYGSLLGQLDENKLLLQSLFDYVFKSKNSSNFMTALQREPLYNATNLRIFALNAQKLGLKTEYLFSATNNKEELLLLHENMLVKKSFPTLTDIKTEIIKGHAVVLTLEMNALNKAAPHKNFFAIITGYNKEGFHMLEYSFSRVKKTFIPTGVFQNAWGKSHYLECIIIKK